MDYKELETEYLDFIKKRKYGTPIVFTKSFPFQDLESHYAGHEKFLAYCVPGGCPCPINMCCWTCFFPYAIYSCITQSKETDAAEKAKTGEDTRYVLFPTMIVALSKGYVEGKSFVYPRRTLNFLDHQHLTQETVINIDSISRDGINGCIQGMFVPALSGILIFGGQTRQVFTGGDRSNQRNYETRKVPEMKMLVPYESAKKFSSQVQQALRNIKSGCYERSLEFAEAPISKEPPTYDEVMKK